MVAMVTIQCKNCKDTCTVRVADRKRGWGKFCSKRCKAINQEKRTGQYQDYLHRQTNRKFGLDTYGRPTTDVPGPVYPADFDQW